MINNVGMSYKVDRTGLTDAQYIKALELSNETMASELYRLRQELLVLTVIPNELFNTK